MGKRKQRDPPPKFATKGTWHTHYVTFFDDLLNSPAYIALRAHAKEAYTILMQEYKGKYTGSTVICPYSTFQEKGMRPNTLSRALTQLEFYDFIKIEHGGLEHTPSKYHFVEDWKKIETKEDAKAVEQRFKAELEKRKLAAKNAKQITTRYGNDIRSNESVSNSTEKSSEIGIENDSNIISFQRAQLTKTLPTQVSEPLVDEEFEHYGRRIIEPLANYRQ